MALPSNQKLVLLALADCADDHGRNVYPSIACVMQKTSMPKRTVQRVRSQLVAAGILVVDGTCPTNPQIPRLRIVTSATLTPGGATLAPGDVSSGMGGVPPETRGGCQALAPVSVLDPSVEPSERESGRRKRRPARPFPDEFTLNEERRKFAEAGGLKDVGLIFGLFKDWALSNDVWKQDWEATWRGWCRRERTMREGKAKPWRR
jgi:hypothetical protein